MPPRRVLPLILRWNESGPLPLRILRMAKIPATPIAPPYHQTGPSHQPFDFTGHMHRLVSDITNRMPEMSGLNANRILFGILQARNNRKHGLQARVTPLRFQEGTLQRQRRGVTYQVQRLFWGEHEYLYLMSFCMPRFQNQEFEDKLVTVFHELHHLHPECNGDLRRHEGRYAIHTHSQKNYDREMAGLAREYLALRPPEELTGFLRLNFAQLCLRHGGVQGVVVPRPKIVPVAWPGRDAAQNV